MQTENARFLTAALDGLSVRHRAIASNLANSSTPNYRRLEVSFEDQLERARQGYAIEPRISRDTETAVGPDGNNVDAMTELGQMTRVELTYQVLARALQVEGSQMRSAITGR